jgi:hypothetical protein
MVDSGKLGLTREGYGRWVLLNYHEVWVGLDEAFNLIDVNKDTMVNMEKDRPIIITITHLLRMVADFQSPKPRSLSMVLTVQAKVQARNACSCPSLMRNPHGDMEMGMSREMEDMVEVSMEGVGTRRDMADKVRLFQLSSNLMPHITL